MFEFRGSQADASLGRRTEEERPLSRLPPSSEYGTCKTVTARFWPWLSGQSPYNLSRHAIFARERQSTCRSPAKSLVRRAPSLSRRLLTHALLTHAVYGHTQAGGLLTQTLLRQTGPTDGSLCFRATKNCWVQRHLKRHVSTLAYRARGAPQTQSFRSSLPSLFQQFCLATSNSS